MKLAVAIPMKPLHLAKARLRPGLNDAARRKLAEDMLVHVMAAVASSNVAEACGIVSSDPVVLARAAEYNFEAIVEPEPNGYNAAAAKASVWAQERRCDALLILPADLPFLSQEDLRNLAAMAAGQQRAVIIAPDASETGTNALLLRPPDIISPAFGLNSFRQHHSLALMTGIEPLIYHSSTTAQDIDWPEDIVSLHLSSLD